MSREVQIVLVVLRVHERRRFGVGGVILAADVGSGRIGQTFGQGGHHAVFDAVVNHLHEVTRTAGTTVQVAVLGSAGNLIAAGKARCGVRSGKEPLRLEDRIETLDDFVFSPPII